MQTEVLYGPRFGREGKLRVGCSAMLFDESGDKVFLTKRTDNGRWCLPGGTMDSGESVAEACEREMFEETGMKIRIKRLTGIYSNPDQLVIYPDGNKVFIIAISFEVEVVEGSPALSDETTDFGYFSLEEMKSMPMHGQHMQRIEDAMKSKEPVIK